MKTKHQQGLEANDRYFTQVANSATNYLWIDKKHCYEIKNNVFIAPDLKAFNDLKGATSSAFHKNIQLKK